MHYVLLATHTAEACPTSNSKVRDMLVQMAPDVPQIAERNSVKLVSGPFVNREHVTVAIVEADNADNVDRFILESRLAQWNSVRVLPSLPLQEGMAEFDSQPLLF